MIRVTAQGIVWTNRVHLMQLGKFLVGQKLTTKVIEAKEKSLKWFFNFKMYLRRSLTAHIIGNRMRNTPSPFKLNHCYNIFDMYEI